MSQQPPHPEPHETGSEQDQQICILWHAPDHEPAEALIRALQNKGMRVTLSQSIHTVFAAACSMQDRARRVVVVLDQRQQLQGVDRLLSAMERFAPRVICWAHEPGANPPMLPIVQPEKPSAATQTRVEQGSDRSATNEEPESGTASPLRLVAQASDDEPQRRTAPLSARDVLNADELDALLAGEMSRPE